MFSFPAGGRLSQLSGTFWERAFGSAGIDSGTRQGGQVVGHLHMHGHRYMGAHVHSLAPGIQTHTCPAVEGHLSHSRLGCLRDKGWCRCWVARGWSKGPPLGQRGEAQIPSASQGEQWPGESRPVPAASLNGVSGWLCLGWKVWLQRTFGKKPEDSGRSSRVGGTGRFPHWRSQVRTIRMSHVSPSPSPCHLLGT